MNIAELTKNFLEKINRGLDQIANHPLLDALDEGQRKIRNTLSRHWRNSINSKSLRIVLAQFATLCRSVSKMISMLIETIINQISSLTGATSNLFSSVTSRVKQRILTSEAWQYALLIRFDKPIGTLLLLWPTLITLWIAAEGIPDTDVLTVFILGVFFMRSAGCAINDYADRKIDAKVDRTKNRPLATGRITPDKALITFMAFSFMAFFLVLFMNKLTIFLSVGGVLLAASYPFMKRYHYLPQVHLGAAFGWAVPMAYAAQANELAPVTWLLFIATILWATAYDTMYAMVDRDDDIKIGVKSTAILFGTADRVIIGVIQLVLILDLLFIGQQLELSGMYYLGVLVASGFALYQQFLIKDRDRKSCFKAFLNNNWFGFILFLGVFLEYQIGGLS